MAGVIDAKPKNLIPKSWVTQAAKSPTAPETATLKTK